MSQAGVLRLCACAQHLSGRIQRHHHDIGRKRVSLAAGINDHLALRPEILAGVMKAAFDLGRKTALYLIDPQISPWERDDKIDLRAGGGAIEIGKTAFRRRCDQTFYNEALPTAASHGMPQDRLFVAKTKQGMHQTAIFYIDARRFDQPLGGVAMPWLKPANEQQIDEQVEIVGDGLGVETEPSCKVRSVHQTRLLMRQHRPEAPQCLSGYSGAEHRHVPLEIGADEILPPAQARAVAGAQKTVRKAAPHPEAVHRLRIHLKGIEGTHFKIADTTGQSFSRLREKIDRRRTQQQEATGCKACASAAIDEPPKDLEKPRQAMDFIKDHQLVLMCREIEFRLAQFRTIGVGFQIQVERGCRLADLQRQRGFTHLTRSQQHHCWRRGKTVHQICCDMAPDHPCIIGTKFQIYKDEFPTPRAWRTDRTQTFHAKRFAAMPRLRTYALTAGIAMFTSCGASSPARAQNWAESWFDNVTYTSPGSFEDQTRGYVTAGGMSGRVDVHNDYLMSLTLPKVKAGCGGIDMFLGGMSFLDPDYLVQKLETILQAAPAVAFQYLLETLDEKMGNIISKMEAATNYLNSIQVNDCRLANRMVQIAKGDENMSGIIEEMTGFRSVKQGFAKSYQQSREKIEANANNPTEDLKDALANCPAEVTDIFRTGSLLSHAAARVGASSWANVMRARVGDVYMRWDATDKVPLFSAIPACPAQDSESPQDFLTGKVQKRTLNIPATANDCTQDGTKGALALARERLEAIAAKIRTKAPLSTEERHFVANVRTLPVYRMLEWGVRQGVVDSVIADTDELVALTLAYQMLNDLTRTIDFALTNAERGTNAAGATDGASPNICQTRILTKGIEQLRDLREEVLRQRAQMRQSYLAALNQANLSANYAGLLRQRDLDARNAAGAAATRNR